MYPSGRKVHNFESKTRKIEFFHLTEWKDSNKSAGNLTTSISLLKLVRLTSNQLFTAQKAIQDDHSHVS